MKTLNVLIVDDEFLARKEMVNRIHSYNKNFTVHQADSVDSAIDILNKERVELIFLDIQLMGETGFDLLDRIEIRADVVFVTAFDEYALRAFEINAVDYLLKPVSSKRFNITMERVLTRTKTEKSKELTYSDKLIEKNISGMRVLKLEDIIYISAEGDYTRVCCFKDNDMLLYRTMKCWENILPKKYFRRIHRSTIINTDYIDKFHKTGDSKHSVEMSGIKKIFTISRTYLSNL